MNLYNFLITAARRLYWRMCERRVTAEVIDAWDDPKFVEEEQDRMDWELANCRDNAALYEDFE